jgi:hypothetical protein
MLTTRNNRSTQITDSENAGNAGVFLLIGSRWQTGTVSDFWRLQRGIQKF